MKEEMIASAKKARLVESYRKDLNEAKEAFGIEDLKYEKQVTLATTIDNTKNLLEATQVQGIGPYKRHAIDMLKVSQPVSIIADIVSEQAIDTMASMINYKKFVYGSTKGEVQNGQTVNSVLGGPFSHPAYASSRIEEEVLDNAGATAVTGSLSWTAVTPGSVVIKAGTVVITDDGAGALVSAGLTANGTIDYETGNFNFTLAAASTDVVTADYSYDNQTAPVTNVPEINLEIVSKPVYAKPYLLKTNYSFGAAYMLKKEYDDDIEASLAAEAAAEILNEQTVEVIRDLHDMAIANPTVTFQRTQAVGVTVLQQSQDFLYTLEEAAAEMEQSTGGKFRPTFIALGTLAAATVRTMRDIFTPVTTTTPGAKLIGKIGDLDVYSCPNAYGLKPDEFVLGYKGTGFLDAGYVYAPYMPILPTDLLMDDTFTGRRGWASYVGKCKLNPQMYVRGRIVTNSKVA
jgi:hypothetical protein